MTKLFSSLLKSSGTSSSQINPRVSKAAYLISNCSCAELLLRLGIIVNHSPLGISILAIAAIALATYLLTIEEGVVSVCNNASLINSLNS